TTHSSWEEEDELLKAWEGPAQWPGWQGRCFSRGRDGGRPTWDPQGGCSTSMFFLDDRDVSMMMSEMDVHAITDRLKLYFHELPEPLFTDEFYPTSMRALVSTGDLGVIGGVSSMCTAAIRAVESEMWEPKLCPFCHGQCFNQAQKAGATTGAVV
ncbi:hypothetical protein P7K49_029581, partial [Saguinus oedipus]